jgi:hypothetical protein
MKNPLPLWLALLALPVPAIADSDGYYCTAQGYVAYQLRAPDGTHSLHLVSFSTRTGIRRHSPIRLADFQVHAMTCRAGAVELEGWTEGYTINITDSQNTTITQRATRFDPKVSGPTPNLGHWSKGGVVDLRSDEASDEFQLLIARVSRPIRGGIEHYTVTELIWRHAGPGLPSLRQTERLFAGVFRETID